MENKDFMLKALDDSWAVFKDSVMNKELKLVEYGEDGSVSCKGLIVTEIFKMASSIFINESKKSDKPTKPQIKYLLSLMRGEAGIFKEGVAEKIISTLKEKQVSTYEEYISVINKDEASEMIEFLKNNIVKGENK